MEEISKRKNVAVKVSALGTFIRENRLEHINWLLEKTVSILTNFTYLIRKALSKKIDMKFLPKVYFIGDQSFDYAAKIEKLIQQNK